MIFVTGGTGFIGKYLLQQLVEQGEQVKALKRNASVTALPENISSKVQWVDGDVLDVASLEEAMQGCDKVYHCAGLVSFYEKDKRRLHKVNVTGTTNVVNVALASDVKKMLHVSSIAALGRTTAENHITEKTQWQDNKLNSEYAVSKHLAEIEVWRGIAEGLNAVIVNPSVVLGVGEWNQGTCKFFSDGYKGMPAYTEGINGFVDVRDVVKLMEMLMNSELSGERFIINAENISYKELLFMIADNFGKKRPSVKASPVLSEIAWRFFKIQSLLTGNKPLITKETARVSLEKFFYDNTKIKEAFNFRFTPVAETAEWICKEFLKEKKS